MNEKIDSGPLISCIVVGFNLRREATRTLFSLSRGYQLCGHDIDYDVHYVDHGSSEPLAEEQVRGFGKHFNYHYAATDEPSPASSLNHYARTARGKHLCFNNDGARLLSPGVLHHASAAIRAFDRPVISVVCYHLGFGLQNDAATSQYGQAGEDRLLESIDWRHNGYRLFEIATLAGSSKNGWFLPLAESNCIVMSREIFDEVGGFDRSFDGQPAGGYLSLDFYDRVHALPNITPVILLGEGTFHQYHGGRFSNADSRDLPRLLDRAHDHYQRLRGRPYRVPPVTPVFLGGIPDSSVSVLERSAALRASAVRGALP